MMKGLVVVICAPPKGGKDYIAGKMMHSLAIYGSHSSYATAYKLREPRKSDGEHIKCVKSRDEVPVPEKNRIEAIIYGTEVLIYDKKEIKKKMDEGEVVFIATASTDLAKKIKAEFRNQCVNVCVKVQQASADKLKAEDYKKYGIDPLTATAEELAASDKRVAKRIEVYDKMKPGMIDLVQDSELGADHIFRNIYTLTGGPGHPELDQLSENEFNWLANKLKDIYSCVNTGRDWKFYSLFEDERKNVDLFTLQDVLMEYMAKQRGKK